MYPSSHNLEGRLFMDSTLKNIVWRQFGSAIDMLENAMRACPDELWQARLWNEPPPYAGFAELWYLAYHTLFFLDFYLSGSVEGFAPPAPFTLDELDPRGLLPERVYTKDELLAYLEYGRDKCRTTLAALTDEQAQRRFSFPWGELSFLELQLDSMRHVQEHAAQMNLFLGQQISWSPRWVVRPKGGDAAE
jgi:hypothetical protein